MKIFYNQCVTISAESRLLADFVAQSYVPAIGSSVNSQHAKAEAADFECVQAVDNAELADWIQKNFRMISLYLSSTLRVNLIVGWIHCSWIQKVCQERAILLHAYRSEGKTKYKPILGSAKDLF